MDNANELTLAISVIIGVLFLALVASMLYEMIVSWPQHQALVRYQQANGCRCSGVWDGTHDERCPFHEEMKEA